MQLIPLARPLRDAILHQQMTVSVALFSAIAMTYVSASETGSAWLSMLVPFLGLAAVATVSPTVRFGTVLALALAVGALVLADYYRAANHGFMLTWTGLALALACACDHPKDEGVLRRNAAALLAILMLVALIQKLRAPYYMSGDLLGGLLVEGDIYANLIGLMMPDWPQMVHDFKLAFQTVQASAEPMSVAIAVPAAVVTLAWRMTIASLLAQAGLEALILLRSRAGMLLHLAILGFVALVYSTRNENVFLSINCLLGYALTDDKTKAARPWYVLAIVYLLSADLIGLRPWIIR